MPQEVDALYSRGKYRLDWDRRADGSLRSPFLQIVWYDQDARRNRSKSTGETQVGAAEDALDRLYMERERGLALCKECGRPLDKPVGYPVSAAIADYLLAKEDAPSFSAIRPRLGHFLDFMDATDRDKLECEQVDAVMIATFRKWSAKIPVVQGGTSRPRAPGTTEATVRQLRAAINFAEDRGDAGKRAQFAPLPPSAVDQTPTHRSDVAELAAMFRYCLYPQPDAGKTWTPKQWAQQREFRRNLLRFLQVSVATWCRPDAAHDLSTDPKRQQWVANARVVQLNPKGRAQTRKHRPAVVVPEKFARLMDQTAGYFVPVKSVRKAFEKMQDDLGLPRDRETGLKLIRRSIASLARPRLGEANWTQGKIMLGHHKASTSDLYALFDPANLGLALAATEAIIGEIEALVPGAFTGIAPELKTVQGGLSV